MKTQSTRTQPLPLILLTGFLGSGKTSTLRHWLAKTEIPLQRVAVIINDFGSVNVDAALLAQRQLELRSITGGCVCCQSFDELVEQVRALADNPGLDLAWIETSGLADPDEVLDHLTAASLQGHAVIRRMILVVDGSDFPCSWRGRAVQEEQIRYADLILLNKTDRIDAARREAIEAQLRSANPSAQLLTSRHGEVDPSLLSADGVHAHASLDDHDGDCRHHDHEPGEKCGHDHSHDHGHDHEHYHDHDHDDEDLPHSASTLFLPLSGPIDRSALERLLASLPASVFRAKGFVRFTESPAQLHIFQQVRDQAELLLLPMHKEAQIPLGLVFIGPHLDEKRIRELAHGLVLTPAEKSLS